MTKSGLVLTTALTLLINSNSWAATYQLDELKTAPPAGAIPEDIAAQLQPTGIRLVRGAQTSCIEWWWRKEIPTEAGFQPTADIRYGIKEGQLLGIARLVRAMKDFRNQEIAAGWYTIRYACQPADGDHAGTFPSRDFVLLSKVQDDTTLAGPRNLVDLQMVSAVAAGSSHPASLPLLKPVATDTPAIEHDAKHDWWILRCKVSCKSESNAVTTPLAIVLVGVAEE